MTTIKTRLLLLILPLLGIVSANAQQPFKRGLEQHSFIPKGQWITGVSVSYDQSHQNDYQFFIIENITGDTYTFKVTPMLMYSFKNNMAAGGKMAYTRSMTEIDRANIKLDSETNNHIDHLYRISNNYYGMACMRNYISFGTNKRFGMFNELQFQFGGGQSKISKGTGKDLTGTYERNYSFDIGLAPGFIMFLNNYSALEVNVGVLGFSYTRTKAVTDQIYVAHRNSQSANFRVNLFSITFGVAFYL